MKKFNQFYYHIRPFIPRRLQIYVRGKVLRRRRSLHKDRWPIPVGDVRAPRHWAGWPGGKRFAFVLTHDVESDAGQNRSLHLMRLEEELGFVSSFNFVPERYEVSPDLRNAIASNGFEVGVHDLKHDGKLHDSRDIFFQKAERINAYLKAWEAVGFRSGAMHHNLEWIHALDIVYDASTFDFDPFEPQPDGMNTIYPIWISNDGQEKGYVELPYTLPQDFTLFVLLQEKSIDIWKRKLDWVAEKGGMALLITHPDYMNFNEELPRFDEYPVRHYTDLLEYVKTQYAGMYWNALPRDVARFHKDLSQTK